MVRFGLFGLGLGAALLLLVTWPAPAAHAASVTITYDITGGTANVPFSASDGAVLGGTLSDRLGRAPVMLVVMGLIIAVLLISIYLPMFSVIGQVQG